MIQTKNSNKDILAKLMATENITVIHKSVPTAYFDVKSRTLCCPIMKEDMSSELYDLFMGHEVSHALNTPVDGWHDKVSDKGQTYKGYLNVIEDVRIEKMIKAKYPGLRKSFYTGYSELTSMNFFGTKGKDLQELNLIDRINLSYKIGSFAQIEFSQDEQVYIDRCESLVTFEDVLSLADDLFDRQNKENENNIESMTQQDIEDLLEEFGVEEEDNDTENMSVETEEGENDSDEEGADANSAGGDDSDSSGDSEGETKDSETGEKSDSETSKEGSEGALGKTPEEQLLDELNKASTDEEFRKNEETLQNKEESYYTEPCYNEIKGRIHYENFIVPSTKIQEHFDNAKPYNDNIKKTVKKFTDDNKKIIGYMVKEFEMKKAAASYNRSWNAKSGEIDMNKLAFYKLKEDIFNRVQVSPEGKSHGIVMTIDWSGSMSGSVASTIEQATLLSMFCRRLAIPFRLFAFSDMYLRRDCEERMNILDTDDYETETRKRDEYFQTRTFGKVVYNEKLDSDSKWHLGELSLLEVYNEKMSNSEFTKSMENWFQLAASVDSRYRYSQDYKEVTEYDENWNNPYMLSLSGTPLDATILAMRDYMIDFKKENNLDITSFIVLSDGASHRTFTGRNPYILDRKLNKTFKLENKYGRTTHGLLEWLKETADCRTIGFFISSCTGSQIAWEAETFCAPKIDAYGSEMDTKRKEFNKLSTAFTDGCYDLAILINQKKISIDTNLDEIDVEVGANKGALKRALVKAGNNKMQQRVILNQFVGQMAV